MKVIIAGTRTITNFKFIEEAIDKSGYCITEIVSGKAKGIDTLAERWGRLNNIPIASFPAYWNKYGKKAGPLRNSEMANYADALIAIWDGQSSGTKDMISKAKDKGLPVFILQV